MIFIIKDPEVVQKLKELEKTYSEKYGNKKFAFIGQIASTIDESVVLKIGSLTKKEFEEMNEFISNRENKSFDLSQFAKIELEENE